MTLRQFFLKAAYPLLMLAGKKRKHTASILFAPGGRKPAVPFHSLVITANNGETIRFDLFKGKKVLICNTASDCGYTAQYADLEKLYRQYAGQLVVIGFPANDFKGQEPLDDAGIAQFCQRNFGVSFLLSQKSQVIHGASQHPVFTWLTNPAKNGWCKQQPTWNFCKYLIDEEGSLRAFFAQNISPLDKQLTDML